MSFEYEVDVERLRAFKGKIDGYIKDMECCIAILRKTASDAAAGTKDGAVTGSASAVSDACDELLAEVRRLETGPARAIGQKVLRYENVPPQFTRGGRSR